MIKPRILLDSGAYSVFRRGAVVELDAYIGFAKRHSHLLEYVVNLDVIPDVDLDVNKACEQSYANQQAMKDAGLKPLAVVHQVDEPGWLEKYLDDREPYIALAPAKRGGRRAIAWTMQCFDTIKQAPYRPKVHGLAVTSSLMMTEFPWTSVDSSTWLQQAKTGYVYVPVYGLDGKPDYRLQPNRYCVTDRMQVECNHIDKLDEFQLEGVRKFLDVCGLSLTEVRHSHHARKRAQITYFMKLEAISGVRLYFVSRTDTLTSKVLRQCGAEHHLLSYFRLRQQRDGVLAKYVEGTVSPSHTRTFERVQRDRQPNKKEARRSRRAPMERGITP
jgi:hypothetical protein